MANLNKVMLIGNLTRDPELRYTPKGTAVAEISLAINRTWSNDSGQKQEETTYVEITLWGKTAELAQQYLTKGRPVYIEGRLTLDTWDDKETGKKRSKLKVIGDTMQFISDGKGRSDAPAAERSRPAPSHMNDNLDQPTDDEDIPF